MNWIKVSGIALIVALFSQSCGIYSLSGINIPADVKTISVSFFPNEAAIVNPQLSQQFSERLKDKFQNETSLTLITTGGDFDFSGKIVEYRVIGIDVQENTNSNSSKFVIGVDVDFKSPNHEELNFTQYFESNEVFDASLAFESVEADMMERIIDEIVQDIFNRTALRW
jgi:hypothetical protein